MEFYCNVTFVLFYGKFKFRKLRFLLGARIKKHERKHKKFRFPQEKKFTPPQKNISERRIELFSRLDYLFSRLENIFSKLGYIFSRLENNF